MNQSSSSSAPLPPLPSFPPHVGFDAPLRWLFLGWRDFIRNPMPGLLHGLLLVAFGWLLLWVGWNRFWFLAGAFSGFLIVAPVVTTGLYRISKNQTTGAVVSLEEVLHLWLSGDGRLVRFGLLLALAGTGWVLTSAALITVYADVPIRNPGDFLRHVVLTSQLGLFELWMILGGFLAAPMFASSVVAIPMLVDTPTSVLQAVQASWRVAAIYPLPLALWAVAIVLLVTAGMLTALLGLLVVVPVLAHASWHAYRELVPVPAAPPSC
jgi:uncharacterized membrane protein